MGDRGGFHLPLCSSGKRLVVLCCLRTLFGFKPPCGSGVRMVLLLITTTGKAHPHTLPAVLSLCVPTVWVSVSPSQHATPRWAPRSSLFLKDGLAFVGLRPGTEGKSETLTVVYRFHGELTSRLSLSNDRNTLPFPHSHTHCPFYRRAPEAKA